MGLVRAAERSLGATAYVLLGTLPHSGRIRGVIAEKMDQAHRRSHGRGAPATRRPGGTAHIWRTDRLSTVIVPGTADVQASFAPVAKHYEAVVEPARRGGATARGRSSPRCASARDAGGGP